MKPAISSSLKGSVRRVSTTQKHFSHLEEFHFQMTYHFLDVPCVPNNYFNGQYIRSTGSVAQASSQADSTDSDSSHRRGKTALLGAIRTGKIALCQERFLCATSRDVHKRWCTNERLRVGQRTCRRSGTHFARITHMK